MYDQRGMRILAAVAVVMLGAAMLPGSGFAQEDPLLGKSREAAVRFASLLESALQDAMASGGPASAIGVCRDSAPRIASRLSRETGAKVSRTSLRFRNPGNAPEPWQAAVLHVFDAPDGPQEFFERTDSGGARYMKAIPTGALCMTCHGRALADEVAARLDEDYPHDRARGYALGDVRGAFSITWPAPD